MQWKPFIRAWLPAGFVRMLGPYLGWRIRFSGDYATWRSASEQASGYDSQEILDRVKAATLAARTEAAFERDGVVLDHAETPFPLLTALLRVAAARADSLNVLDFGGSLGSSYYQCRPFLTYLKGLRWSIVEQPGFVECGKKLFEDGVLKFFNTIDESLQGNVPDVILLSAVLQYLEQPLDLLEKAVEIGPATIVIDRTPVVAMPENRIVVQMVPRRFGNASYPAWLFSRDRLLAPARGSYRIVAEYDAIDGVMTCGSGRVDFKGFILDKTNEELGL